MVKVRFSVSLNVNSIDFVDITCNECRVCQHPPHTQTPTHTHVHICTHTYTRTHTHTHTHTH